MSVFSWMRGRRRKPSFFFLCVLHEIERGESEVQAYFVVVGVLLTIFWSKRVPSNEIMRNPFSQIFFYMKRPPLVIFVLPFVHALLQQLSRRFFLVRRLMIVFLHEQMAS